MRSSTTLRSIRTQLRSIRKHGGVTACRIHHPQRRVVDAHCHCKQRSPRLFRRVPSHYWQNHINRHCYRDWLTENNGGKP